MTDPIPTITFEGIKVAMHQTKDGIKVTLVIHPNDIPAELLTDPVGSRYRVVMVLLDDEDKPNNRLPSNSAVMAAGRLAKDPRFQQWVVDEGVTLVASEEEAAKAIRTACMVRSRSEFATDHNALARFNNLRLKYSQTVPGD